MLEGKGFEQKRKRTHGHDNSVVIAGGREHKGTNGNGKYNKDKIYF